MPSLAGAPAQAGLLFVVSGALLMLGYQCGRYAASGKRVGPSQAFVNRGLPGANGSDFDPTNLTEALLEKLKAARSAAASRPVAALAAVGGLAAQRREAEELHGAVTEALGALASSFSADAHPKLARALSLLSGVEEGVQAAWQALLPAAAERLSPAAQDAGSYSLERSVAHSSWMLSVTVSEKPFGMHVKRGATSVEEVFPGFQAHKAGIRKGCELLEVAGQRVESGTWLDVFQKSPVPFAMKLSCTRGGSMAGSGQNLLSQDQHRYRVMVTKKPYGMNVQANKLPRVVEVLPGFPAEAAGVQRGFVLTEVNDVPVDVRNWFEEYQAAQLPFTLTFDTRVPLHADNPFFAEETPSPDEASPPDAVVPTEEPAPGAGFEDFRCSVESRPFGAKVLALPHRRPRIMEVREGSPASRAGVRVGDVLMEVAGRPVTSRSWFAALQQAIPPFGLLLRRPNNATLPSGRRLADVTV